MTDAFCRVLLGDCVEVMRLLPAESVHAIVCDPPYGLEFMGKDWDTFGAARARIGRGGHLDNGDGGEKWDAPRPQAYVAGVPFQQWTQQWATEALRVLKPGGHLLAFGGTRTYHRLACGLEDAGFEIRDSLHWIYGSGFPKSMDVSAQMDRAAGVERPDRVVTEPGSNLIFQPTQLVVDAGAPVTAAAAWQGWGTALKPAHEPVVMARKPLSGTVTDTVLAYGTGAINIAATRIAGHVTATKMPRFGSGVDGDAMLGNRDGAEQVDWEADAGGRWPANVLLSHLPECKGSGPNHTDVLCAPGCPVAELNEMSGESSSAASRPRSPDGPAKATGALGREGGMQVGHDDSGGAARFFYVAKPKTRERIGGTVRNLHPTVKPVDLMRYLIRLVTPPGGIVLDPFLGSGTTGCAAMIEGVRFIGIEREQESFDTSLGRISDYAFAHGRPRPVTSLD